jgi:archaellum component FlaC
LEIIDGEINPSAFNRKKVCKDIDDKAMPQFGKVKQSMEKCKKYLKSVKESVVELENAIKYFSLQEEKNQNKYEKYDRFLKQKTH